jgi:hypothetical protein
MGKVAQSQAGHTAHIKLDVFHHCRLQGQQDFAFNQFETLSRKSQT